jgi:pyruvate kinase
VKGEVTCVAQNDAVLDGLLTVFHMERSSHELSNVQNTLPVLSESDRMGLVEIAKSFEVDFITLSMARTAADIKEVGYCHSSSYAINGAPPVKLKDFLDLLIASHHAAFAQ